MSPEDSRAEGCSKSQGKTNAQGTREELGKASLELDKDVKRDAVRASVRVASREGSEGEAEQDET